MGIGCCSSPERRQRSLDEQQQFSPRQLLEGPPLAIAPDSIIIRRWVIPPGSAHRRPLVPSRLCHAVSAFRLAIKSCHDWRDGGTCPAGIGDCDIAGCSCGADTPRLRKTPVSRCREPPLAIPSFFICPGGVVRLTVTVQLSPPSRRSSQLQTASSLALLASFCSFFAAWRGVSPARTPPDTASRHL